MHADRGNARRRGRSQLTSRLTSAWHSKVVHARLSNARRRGRGRGGGRAPGAACTRAGGNSDWGGRACRLGRPRGRGRAGVRRGEVADRVCARTPTARRRSAATVRPSARLPGPCRRVTRRSAATCSTSRAASTSSSTSTRTTTTSATSTSSTPRSRTATSSRSSPRSPEGPGRRRASRQHAVARYESFSTSSATRRSSALHALSPNPNVQDLGEARGPEPRRFVEGPHRQEDGRARRARRRAAPGRDDPRAVVGQHRHRPRARCPPPRLPAAHRHARERVDRAPPTARDLRCRGHATSPGEEGSNGAIRMAEKIAADHPEYVLLFQYGNPANPLAHYEGTGPEIWRDCPEVDVFVAGLGTSGTLMGVGRYLKERKPEREDRRGRAAGGRARARSPQSRRRVRAADLRRRGARPEVHRAAARIDRGDPPPARRMRRVRGHLVGRRGRRARSRWPRQMDAGTIVTLLPDGGWKYLSSGAWTDDSTSSKRARSASTTGDAPTSNDAARRRCAPADSSRSRPRRSTASVPTPRTPTRCARVYAVKGRPADHPVIVHFASADSTRRLRDRRATPPPTRSRPRAGPVRSRSSSRRRPGAIARRRDRWSRHGRVRASPRTRSRTRCSRPSAGEWRRRRRTASAASARRPPTHVRADLGARRRRRARRWPRDHRCRVDDRRLHDGVSRDPAPRRRRPRQRSRRSSARPSTTTTRGEVAAPGTLERHYSPSARVIVVVDAEPRPASRSRRRARRRSTVGLLAPASRAARRATAADRVLRLAGRRRRVRACALRPPARSRRPRVSTCSSSCAPPADGIGARRRRPPGACRRRVRGLP